MAGIHIVKDHPALKSCPCCGGKAHVVTEHTSFTDVNRVTVVCEDCRTKLKRIVKKINQDTIKEACNFWNMQLEGTK